MDVSIKAVLQGFSEAVRGFGELTDGTKELAKATTVLSDDQKRLNENYARSEEVMSRKAAQLQKLKDHTEELVKKFQDQEAIEKSLDSIGLQIGDMIGGKILKYVSLTAAVGGLYSIFKQTLGAEKESIETGLRLEAMLQSTGSTAGFTKIKLEEMATALAASTRFDDEGIKSGMSLMLTFGNVQGDVFTRSSRLALDYAELMKTDVTSAFRLMGRALEDPVSGMGQLGRAIGNLSPEQKRLIKDLQDTGDVIGAQNALLDILEGKFGGLAEKMGQSSVTASDRLKKSWNELLEEMGRTGGVTDRVASKLDWITSKLVVAASWLVTPTVGAQALTVANLQRPETFDANMSEPNTFTEEGLAAWLKLEERKQEARDAAARRAPKMGSRYSEAQTSMKETVNVLQLGAADASEAWDDFYAGWAQAAQGNAKLQMHINSEWTDAIKKREEDTEKAAEKETRIREKQARDQERDLGIVTAAEERYYNQGQAGLRKLQDAVSKQANDEIQKIRETVYVTRDERIVALKELANSEEYAGLKGIKAQQDIQKELRHTKTDAQAFSEDLAKIFTYNVPQSILKTVGTIKGDLSTAIYDIVSGNKSLGESLESFFKGVSNSILKMLADIAASEIMKWIFAGSPMGAMLGIGSSVASGAASAAGGTGVLGSIGSGISGLFSGGSAATTVGGGLAATGTGAAVTGAGTTTGVIGATSGFAAAALPLVGAFAVIMGLDSLFGEDDDPIALAKQRAEAAADQDAFLRANPWSSNEPGAWFQDFSMRGQSTMKPPGIWPSKEALDDAYNAWAMTVSMTSGYATGTDMIVTRPTVFTAGEMGTERVTVVPLGGSNKRGDGVSITINGPAMFDEYTFRLFQRMILGT